MRNSVRLGLVALACAGVALAGCGSQRAGAPAAGAGTSDGSTAAAAGSSASATASAQTPAQQAAADAAGLLAAFPVPPGAMRTGALPVSWLSASPEPVAGPDVVTRTGWWRVAGQPVTVLSWIRAHMPSGFSLELSGASEGQKPRIVAEPAFPHPGPMQPGARMWFAQYTKPPVPNVLTTRWLVVSVAADGTGQTAIRVDSEVAWAPAKPAAERIPAAATVVTIAPVLGNGPVPADDAPVTITDQAKVTKIASAVNALPPFPVGRMMCPMIRGSSMRLTFRTAAAGPALAVVTANTTGCRTVAVTILGHQYPVLAGAYDLEKQVISIAGVRWPGFPA
jgi:hypothetical protein